MRKCTRERRRQRLWIKWGDIEMETRVRCTLSGRQYYSEEFVSERDLRAKY
jgi:hypothetical protein